jgi:hypothetical protein
MALTEKLSAASLQPTSQCLGMYKYSYLSFMFLNYAKL